MTGVQTCGSSDLVKISSNVLGKAAIQLLQNKQAHNFPPLQVNLPITIFEGESVQNVKIDRMHNI